MQITPDNKIKKLFIVGDRVLIKPLDPAQRTSSGLFLPPGVQENVAVRQGIVIKAGPGYPMPGTVGEDELWKGQQSGIKYMPLQIAEGDMAIFLVAAATEVIYQNDKYFIVPQQAVLMFEREEDL